MAANDDPKACNEIVVVCTSFNDIIDGKNKAIAVQDLAPEVEEWCRKLGQLLQQIPEAVIIAWGSEELWQTPGMTAAAEHLIDILRNFRETGYKSGERLEEQGRDAEKIRFSSQGIK